MTLHQTNQPNYMDHMAAVVGTACENDHIGARSKAIAEFQHVTYSIRDIIRELRNQLSTLNDAYAPENLGWNPEEPRSEGLAHAWYDVGMGQPDNPMSKLASVLVAAETAAEGIARNLDTSRMTVDWDIFEGADYHHSNTPDPGARLPIYGYDHD